MGPPQGRVEGEENLPRGPRAGCHQQQKKRGKKKTEPGLEMGICSSHSERCSTASG